MGRKVNAAFRALAYPRQDHDKPIQEYIVPGEQRISLQVDVGGTLIGKASSIFNACMGLPKEGFDAYMAATCAAAVGRGWVGYDTGTGKHLALASQ
ncbi:MAG TPA: hypothetical protein VIS10_07705 [Anaerolineales bacterium]